MPRVVVRSYHHLATPEWRRCFHTVSRAGHLQAGSAEEVRRSSCVGQDVLFCLKGRGWVESDGRRHEVLPQQLVWLANEQSHAHTAHSKHPWELVWVRLEGPGLIQLRSLLFERCTPILIADTRSISNWFTRLFGLLESEIPGVDLRLHQLIGELFCLISATGCNGRTFEGTWLSLPDSLRRVVQAIRLHPENKWPAAEMARLAGVSPAQIRKLAARHLHMSPQQWLVRERIALAQNLLAESESPVGGIAERCG